MKTGFSNNGMPERLPRTTLRVSKLGMYMVRMRIMDFAGSVLGLSTKTSLTGQRGRRFRTKVNGGQRG